MAALGWLLNLDFAASEAAVVVPDTEGLEYTFRRQRLHYTMTTQRAHYAYDDQRAHYTIAEND